MVLRELASTKNHPSSNGNNADSNIFCRVCVSKIINFVNRLNGQKDPLTECAREPDTEMNSLSELSDNLRFVLPKLLPQGHSVTLLRRKHV
jgi:hypothetical protein